MSSFDNEVEKYMHKNTTGSKIPEKSFCSSSRTLKRPASALSSSNEPRTPPKVEYCPKTPKTLSKSNRKKTPCKYRTPTKTPTDSDRFIPPRGSMNFSSSHYKIMQGWSGTGENDNNTNNNNGCADISRTFENVMHENINRVLSDANTPRILQFQSKATTPSKGIFSIFCYSEIYNFKIYSFL